MTSLGKRPAIEGDPEPQASGVSMRAVAIGSLLCLIIAVGELYGVLVVRGSAMAADFSTGGAIFLFFLLVLLINPVLHILGRSGLQRRELVTVYMMMIVAAAIPSWGLTVNLIPLMAGFFYYATPGNNWAEEIHPYLPDWLVVRDMDAVNALYIGGVPGGSIPWDEWIRPLLAWAAFAVTLYFVTLCLLVILRRQWMENEKLIFPLAILPLEMTDTEDGTVVSSLFRNPLTWVGFLTPAIIKSSHALHSYHNFFPAIDVINRVQFFGQSIYLQLTPFFEVIGLSYLLSVDVSLAVWLFAFLSLLATGMIDMFGLAIGPVQPFSDPAPPSVAHVAFGALAFLVLSSFWHGRGHVKAVVRKAVGRAPDVDDSRELLSYRTAVFGSVIGAVAAGFWLGATGLNFQSTVVFLIAALVIFVGVARIISQTGLAYARATVPAPVFAVNVLGSSAVGPAGLTALGLSFAWAADLRTFVMASAATGLKMAYETGLHSRRLFWPVILAIAIAFAGSVWAMLSICYTYGGLNLNSWQFGALPTYAANWITWNADDPQSMNVWHVGFVGIGTVLMGLMMYLKGRFVGFPIHPVGMTLGLTWPVYNIWFSVFLAWLLKTIILKYYGSRGYRYLRPFFLGMVLGGFVTAGTWLVIDGFTGMSGNILVF